MIPHRSRTSPARTSSDPRRTVTLTVNGESVTRSVSVRLLLSDFLRHDLGLTGTHVGCEHGVCGACTVHIDGHSARACLGLVVALDGAEIRTIESVAAPDGTLHPLQAAFHDCHALQCGYCTPGMIMALLDPLESGRPLDLSDDGVRDLLSGNLCRCTGYAAIVEAVRSAAARLTVAEEA